MKRNLFLHPEHTLGGVSPPAAPHGDVEVENVKNDRDRPFCARRTRAIHNCGNPSCPLAGGGFIQSKEESLEGTRSQSEQRGGEKLGRGETS